MYHFLWGCKTIKVKVIQFLLRIPTAVTNAVDLWLDIHGPQRKKSNEFIYPRLFIQQCHQLKFQIIHTSISIFSPCTAVPRKTLTESLARVWTHRLALLVFI